MTQSYINVECNSIGNFSDMDLKSYLEHKGMSMVQFGKIIGTSHSHISYIISGKRSPSLALTRRIIEATDGKVNVGDLFHPDTPTRLKNKDFNNEKT